MCSIGGNKSGITPNESLVNGTQEECLDNTTAMYTPIYLQVLIITIYGVIICLAIGGNAIICCIIVTSRRMRTPMNMFIVNLACGDLFMSIFCIPFSFISNLLLNYWAFGAFMCPAVLYLQGVFVFVSSFTLVAISIDRYIAIIHPLRQKLSKRKALVTLLVIWAVSLIIPLPSVITARLQVDPDDPLQLPRCYEVWPKGDNYRSLYSVCVLILQYFIPLAIFTFAYGRISFVMWGKKIPGEAQSSRDRKITESKKKIIKMMITVVVIYAVCWLPLHLITIVGDIHPDIYFFENIHIVWLFVHWLAMSNSCYNPFVYCWMNSRFRDGFKHVLCCCARRYIRGFTSVELKNLTRQDTFLTSASSTCRRPYFKYMSDKIADHGSSSDKSLVSRNGSTRSSVLNGTCHELRRSQVRTENSFSI